MRHFVYYTNLLLSIILCSLLTTYSVQAQSEGKVQCAMTFTDTEFNYDSNEVHVEWLVDTAPVGYDTVAIRIKQNGQAVPGVDGKPWRYYPMNVSKADLDVTNLLAGKFTLDAMLLDGVGSPCKDSDKGIWLAKSEDELEWNPPTVSYEVKNFQPEYEKGSVSFDIDVKEPKYDVNYTAWIELGKVQIGVLKKSVIDSKNNSPERVEIPITGIDLNNLTQETHIKIYVEAWYTDNQKTPIRLEEDVPIAPTPKGLGVLLDKIGHVVMAVLKSQTAMAGILLTLGVLLVVKIYSKDSKPAKPEYGRPPKNPIVKPQILTPAQASLKPLSFSVRIRQATASRYENVISLAEFPCVFGRNKHLENGQTEKNNGKLFTNILHDAKISREHFEIRQRDHKFYIASRSENGTKVNQHLVAKGEQVVLSLLNPTIVEIGEQTQIELQPI